MKKTTEEKKERMKRAEEISEALGAVGDDLLADADGIRDSEKKKEADDAKKQKAQKRKRLISVGAGIAAVLVIAGFGISTIPNLTLRAHALAEAEYPQQIQYPTLAGQLLSDIGLKEREWQKDSSERRRAAVGKTESLWSFTGMAAAQILGGTDARENPILSPLSVYMALGMLSEITEGQTQSEILSVLGGCSQETLREEANAVWTSAYTDDRTAICIPANSLWFDNHLDCDNAVLRQLADTYYASSYQGAMGSSSFDRAFVQWLGGQTGGMLDETVKGMHFEPYPDNVFALSSTLSFAAKWNDKFRASNTEKEIFHGTAGDETVPFMKKQKETMSYYWGDGYGAVSLSFELGGDMWFILPDEGVTPSEVLAAGNFWDIVRNPYGEDVGSKHMLVNLAIPKFDTTSDLDLKADLQALGVKSVFDGTAAEFSLFDESETTEAWVSAVRHAARVTIDEEGCTATAFTVLPGAGAAEPPTEIIDFVCDRPFVFVITGRLGTNDDCLPLYVGIVEEIG